MDSSQERKLEVNPTPRQTLLQTIIPPICSSKDPLIFPKKSLTLPLEVYILPPLPLLKWYLSLNSKPPRMLLIFSWLSPMCT